MNSLIVRTVIITPPVLLAQHYCSVPIGERIHVLILCHLCTAWFPKALYCWELYSCVQCVSIKSNPFLPLQFLPHLPSSSLPFMCCLLSVWLCFRPRVHWVLPVCAWAQEHPLERAASQSHTPEGGWLSSSRQPSSGASSSSARGGLPDHLPFHDGCFLASSCTGLVYAITGPVSSYVQLSRVSGKQF